MMAMSFLHEHWRHQKAVNRARQIRRYRKGDPKLGCYKCWYDCYEVEGDRCPECNAEIDRGAPWWRDGRFSLWIAAAMLFFSKPVKLLGPYLTLRHVYWNQNPTGVPASPPWYYMPAAAGVSLVLLVGGVSFALSRTRRSASMKRRVAVSGVALIAGSLLAWGANQPLMNSIGGSSQPPPTASTPSPQQPSPAGPASGSAP